MGWEQILPAIIGLLGGSLFGGNGTTAATPTADQTAMQSLMKQMLEAQFGEYNYNSGLRKHISDTASWLLPRSSRMTDENGHYPDGTMPPPPTATVPGGPHSPDDPTTKIHPTPVPTPTGGPGPGDPSPGAPKIPLRLPIQSKQSIRSYSSR